MNDNNYNCSSENTTIDVVPLHCYRPEQHGPRCRDPHGYFGRDEFARWTCSKCFFHIFDMILDVQQTVKRPALYYDRNLIIGTGLYTEDLEAYEPDALRNDSAVCSKFLTDDQCSRWRRCCTEALRCCDGQLSRLSRLGSSDASFLPCGMTWDGFACWNATEAGNVAVQHCPDYYRKEGTFLSSPLLATKTCTETGWFNNHSMTAPLEWTNTSHCISDESLDKLILQVASTLSVLFHSISLFALVLCIIVLLLCRNIGSDISRLMLKVHFMLVSAFACLHTVLLVYETVFHQRLLQTPHAVPKDSSACKILNVAMWYFRGASNCSLLCEVFYLLRRMQIRSEIESFLVYFLVASLVPLIPVATLVGIRQWQNPSNYCWMIDDFFTLIIPIPNIIILLINLVVLVVVQYRVIRSYQAAKRYLPNLVVIKRGVKVAGLLLPVFGVQNVAIIYRPEEVTLYDLLEPLVIGTQGTIIAIVYCGFNNEIRKELRRVFNKYQRYRRSTGFTSSAMSIIRRSNTARSSGTGTGAETQRLSTPTLTTNGAGHSNNLAPVPTTETANADQSMLYATKDSSVLADAAAKKRSSGINYVDFRASLLAVPNEENKQIEESIQTQYAESEGSAC